MTTISRLGAAGHAASASLKVWKRPAVWGTLRAWIHMAGSHAEAALKLEFHHINYVSKDVDALHKFYVDILKMDDIAPQNFPRTDATDKTGYDGHIKFATEGSMQMHLAEQDFDVAARNGRHINPVERGHIAFRTDDIEAFMAHLSANGIEYADYGTAFAAEWHQIFFYDPEGNIIEVHQQVV